MRLRSVSEHAATVEADMRREYGLHPWEAMDLPVVVFIRYVSGLSGKSVTAAILAKTTSERTVVDTPTPTPSSEAEHRRRLSALRGYR
jgi:hypothetical protein